MVKQVIGVTSNGRQEKCRWDKSTPCPRHRMHSGNKDSFKTLKMVDISEGQNSDAVSVEDYMHSKTLLTSESELSEEELMFLKRYRFVEVDEVFYRFNNNGKNLDSFRMVNNIEDFTEEEFNQLIETNLLVVDEVEYSIETDIIGVERLHVEQKDSDAPYLRLNNWLVEEHNVNVPEYIESQGNKNQILDYDLESTFMNGGCAVYALAFIGLNPTYDVAVETFEDSNGITYNHVFCINPQTGESYDARGRFESPEKLYDYKNDTLVQVNPTMKGEASHEIWALDYLQEFIDDGFFTYDDTPEDLDIVKMLITSFNKRFK